MQDEIIQLLKDNEELGVNQIARKLDFNPSTVYYKLKKNPHLFTQQSNKKWRLKARFVDLWPFSEKCSEAESFLELIDSPKQVQNVLSLLERGEASRKDILEAINRWTLVINFLQSQLDWFKREATRKGN